MINENLLTMEIQEIKNRLNILEVLRHYGLKPDRNNMLKCPFHADDTASMKIYLQTNTFHCLSRKKSSAASMKPC
jgi:DNA primase